MKIRLSIVSFAFLLVFLPSVAMAAPGAGNFGGWAWSATIGWVSFSSTDAGAGGGPYVVAADGSGNLSGYAWSSNLGWISFNQSDTSSCGARANVNFLTGAVTGFAVAMSSPGRSNYFNGCIELSGTNHPSPGTGVTMNTTNGTFAGYAWGGAVIGWIQFDTGSGGVTLCPGGCVVTPPVTVSGSCSPSTVTNLALPGNVTFTALASGDASGYYYSWDGGAWTSSAVSGSNQDTVFYGSAGNGPLLSIRDHNNNSASTVSASPGCGNVTVNSSSPINLFIGQTIATANKTSIAINKTQSYALAWTSSLSAGYSCAPAVTPSITPAAASWLGSSAFTSNGNTSLMTTDTSTVSGQYTFSLTCTKAANPTYTPSVILRITSTSVNEI